MNNAVASVPRYRRAGTRIAAGSVVVASLATAYAFTAVFARPGESALSLVPADAMIVGSLDLSPSPGQAMTFKKIDDALARNGMDQFVERGLIDIFENSSQVDDIRPHTLRNAAFGLLPMEKGGKREMKGVMLLGLSDGPKVAEILRKRGKPQFFKGMPYYRLPKGKMAMVVFDDVLALADDGSILLKVKQVRDGAAPAITSNQEFMAAREKVANDANLMMFMNPKMLGDHKGTDKIGKDWMTAGLAIRDGGLEMTMSGALDPTQTPEIAQFGKTAPIRRDLFQVLPSGAYGMVVASQPANYFGAAEGVLKSDGDGKDMLKSMEEGVKDGTGLSYREDLVPALQGNAVIAAYPTESGDPAGVDLLLVSDDSNGANPAAAVEKFQQFAEQKMAEEKKGQSPFTKTEVEGARSFRLADELQNEIRQGMSKDMATPEIRSDVLFKKKTVVWAIVDRTVIAATSQDLLDRAVASYRAKTSTLSADRAFSEAEPKLLDGSQSVVTFNLARVAKGVGNTLVLDKMDREGRDMARSILSMFETLHEPLYIKSQITPEGKIRGGTFIPMDYDKMIDFAGRMMKREKK
jgi:hypothetical protein